MGKFWTGNTLKCTFFSLLAQGAKCMDSPWASIWGISPSPVAGTPGCLHVWWVPLRSVGILWSAGLISNLMPFNIIRYNKQGTFEQKMCIEVLGVRRVISPWKGICVYRMNALSLSISTYLPTYLLTHPPVWYRSFSSIVALAVTGFSDPGISMAMVWTQ